MNIDVKSFESFEFIDRDEYEDCRKRQKKKWTAGARECKKNAE